MAGKVRVEDALARNEKVKINVRSAEGCDFEVMARPEATIFSLKQEIWDKIGVRMQMSVGVEIVDFLKDYLETSETAYSQFLRLPASEQVLRF